MYLRKECNGTYTLMSKDQEYFGDFIEIGLTLHDLGVSWKEIETALVATEYQNYTSVTFEHKKCTEIA